MEPPTQGLHHDGGRPGLSRSAGGVRRRRARSCGTFDLPVEALSHPRDLGRVQPGWAGDDHCALCGGPGHPLALVTSSVVRGVSAPVGRLGQSVARGNEEEVGVPVAAQRYRRQLGAAVGPDGWRGRRGGCRPAATSARRLWRAPGGAPDSERIDPCRAARRSTRSRPT